MNLRELFEKIYNNEITDREVIVEHIKDKYEEYDNYILNDNFDFWEYNGDGILSLNFFVNDESQERTFDIISQTEYKKIILNKEKEEEIKELQEKLERLKGEM